VIYPLKSLQETLAGCGRCNRVGLYFDPQVEAGRYGRLRVCRCVEEQCRCGGRPPYHYWDEESRSHWCGCRPFRLRLVQINRLFAQAEIPARYKWKFLEDFASTAPDGTPIPLTAQVAGYVSSLADGDEQPRRGFLLHGPPGTGKTLLGCIVLNELMLRWGKAGRFLNLSRTFFQKLRDTFSEDSQYYGQTWQIFEQLCRIPFLMLDDLGIQRGTEWEMEMLYDLVDARYGEERLTIVTTNQPLEEIKALAGGRIYSRLGEMCHLLEMGSVDYRQHLQGRR
jgi:DNA replication protein DnaC